MDVIGLNCSSGPHVMLETLEKMAAFTEKPLSALPNAGLPASVEGRNIYLCSAEYMAACAARFVQAGASIVGGCCGTTPEHIKEIRNEIRSLQPGHTSTAAGRVTFGEPADKPKPMEKVPVADKSKLGAKLAAGTFVTLVEVFPPRGLDTSQEIAAAKLYKKTGFNCIVVPDGPRSGARLSAQIACQLIQQEAAMEAVLHVCCRDRNILSIQSELLGAHKVGVRNLICLTSDPPLNIRRHRGVRRRFHRALDHR